MAGFAKAGPASSEDGDGEEHEVAGASPAMV
jgi:hypothetical protein